MNIYGEYFYGNKISDYGLEHNRVDYGTLAKAFDAVLNNGIMEKTYETGYWEQESGFVDNSEEIEELQERIEEIDDQLEGDYFFPETMKIIRSLYDYAGIPKFDVLEKERELRERQIEDLEYEQDEQPEVFQWYIVDDVGAELLKEINEIVYYNAELDMYVWGVTHWGTSWSYVLTDIPCNTGKIA